MCFFLCGWHQDSRDGLLVEKVPPHDESSRALTTTDTNTVPIRVPIYKKISRQQCPLIDYTWERQWTKVVGRCCSHPSEACCVSDHSGRTALHLASFNHGCPNYVAVALIEANPHALIKQDSYGQTPLHYACQFRGGTNDLVVLYCQKLVEFSSRMDVRNACPSITASPLYLACKRNAPIHVLNSLVSTRKSMGTTCWIAPMTGGEPYWDDDNNETHGTKSPLSVLIDSCKDDIDIQINLDVRQQMKDAVLSINDEESVCGCQDSPADTVMVLWLKCLVLLREHLSAYTQNTDDASLLHLLASLRELVPVWIKHCALVFPEAALQRDYRGYVPLHYALLNPATLSSDAFTILLHHYPEAATCAFPNGKSPLVVALQQQRLPWNSLQELVMADPDALTQRDAESGLYPFQLAASLNSDTSAIYGLLRLRPDLLLLVS